MPEEGETIRDPERSLNKLMDFETRLAFLNGVIDKTSAETISQRTKTITPDQLSQEIQSLSGYMSEFKEENPETKGFVESIAYLAAIYKNDKHVNTEQMIMYATRVDQSLLENTEKVLTEMSPPKQAPQVERKSVFQRFFRRGSGKAA